jgi:hypothetical protein
MSKSNNNIVIKSKLFYIEINYKSKNEFNKKYFSY